MPLDDGLTRVLGRYDRGSHNSQYISGTGQGQSIAGGGQYPNIGTRQDGPFPLSAGWAAGLQRQNYGGGFLPMTVKPPWMMGSDRGQTARSRQIDKLGPFNLSEAFLLDSIGAPRL